MILRSLLLRHGRSALPRPSSPFRASHIRRLTTTSPSHAQPTPGPSSSSPDDDIDTTAVDYHFHQHQKAHTLGLGTQLSPHYKPHELLSNPPRPADITLELLLASQSHMGHSTQLWNPANAKYIFGIRGDTDPIHIISLDVTASHLRRACKVVEGVAAKGGLILFVGTRANQARAVVRAAGLAGGCHLFDKWTPGTLTNGQQILGRCAKKVVNELDEEVPGFGPQLKYSAAVKPDLVVCLNPLENYTLLHECGIHNIPTIGIIDTDANPTWVTYPIPANDDSLRCVQVIAGALGRAGEAGQKKRLERASEGIVDFEASHGLTMPTKEEFEAARRGTEGRDMEDEDDEEDLLVVSAGEEEGVETDDDALLSSEREGGQDSEAENSLSPEEAVFAEEPYSEAKIAGTDGLTQPDPSEEETFGDVQDEDDEALLADRAQYENADEGFVRRRKEEKE